jgi:GDP-L-fucose synthase
MKMNLTNKKILITGSRGFLGHALVPMLKKKGIEPFVFDSSSYDLRNEEHVKQLLKWKTFDIVIHLAVDGGGIGYTKENPGSVFYNNLMMNTILMEQCRLKGIEKFVGIGSICEYPKITGVPFREKDLWKGYPEETNASYGLSKKMMLVQGQAYRQQYDFNAIHLLPVNMYGPYDNFDLESSHVIPALIRRMAEAKENKNSEIVLWGTGKASREFLYVKDCADAIIKATEKYDKPEPVNIGTGLEVTIKDLAYKIRDLVGFEGRIIWDASKPDGQPRRCLDVSKAEREFGFKAKTSFDEGLEKTIEWY